MPSKPISDTTPLDPPDARPPESDLDPADPAELIGNLTQFSQRLASFGLGESPDPLLTEARPPSKRRRA